MAKFKNVIFDFDSTLVSIEGLDTLAAKKGCEAEIATITNAAMNGELLFSQALQLRWEKLSPTTSDFAWLTKSYKKALLPDVKSVIAALQKQKIRVFIVTGGIKSAILPVARFLGVASKNVFAVCTKATALDPTCLMTTDQGKSQIIKKVKKTGKTAVVGDGMTDYKAAQNADLFIGFGGVVKRDAVKKSAAIYIEEPKLSRILEYLC